MKTHLNICILIPTYNEAKAIGQLVTDLKAFDLDILIADDGSLDETAKIAQNAGARVLAHKMRTGKGATLRRGFDYILKHGYDGVITMDGDGQHAPDDLPQFLMKIGEQPVSLIVGDRLQNPKGMPFLRFCVNVIMSYIISIGCGCKIYDSQSGFRYMHRAILENIEFISNSYEIESELLMKSAKKGYPILAVGIKTIYGDEKSNINPIIDTWRFIKYYFKEIFSSKQ